MTSTGEANFVTFTFKRCEVDSLSMRTAPRSGHAFDVIIIIIIIIYS